MLVRSCFAVLFLAVLFTIDTTSAQVANPELEACRATGLIALRERNPAIKDVSLDMDSMTVAKANTKVEDTPIRTIIVGDAYLEQGKKDSRRTFLCLIGEKGNLISQARNQSPPGGSSLCVDVNRANHSSAPPGTQQNLATRRLLRTRPFAVNTLATYHAWRKS
jgi:hypothetical protein